MGKEMLKVCDGLPLAIVALGGILRKKQTLEEWQSVHNNISSYIRMGSDHGRSCMDILLQSYNDLPFHLKPCFLYLAQFPEDYEIQTQNLYWMWTAEGLVTRSSCTDRTSGSRKSLEEVANDYMNELALVGLVEIVYKTSEGWIESIRMHDLVRDVCLEKATVEDFLKIMDVRPGHEKQQLTTSDYYSSNRLIRLSIYLSEDVDKSILIDSLFSKAHKYIRSLLFKMPSSYDNSEDQFVARLMESICNELRMLRVLVLTNMRLKGRLTTQVGNLLHLRYLSLEWTSVSELPSSIRKLRFLEILNLKVRYKLIIPNTLWKLFRLRHLLLPSKGYEIKKASKLRGWNSPLSVNVSEETEKLRADTLIWLETIENMQVKKHRTKDLLKIKNLTSLSLISSVSDEKEMQDIIAALKSSAGRCSMIRVEGDVISEKNPTILSGFVCNHELEISGRISVPLTQNFSQFLVELRLENCELEVDPMRILGSLCRLRVLHLFFNSYVGKKLSCHSNSFPVLTELMFRYVEKLEVLELENGSMPMLEIIIITGCENFNGIPDILPSSLKVISISRMRSGLKGGVNLEGEGQIEIVDTNDIEKTLKDAVLKDGEYNKFVLLRGGMEAKAMRLDRDKDVNRHFDAFARICIPRGRRSDAVIPRHILQQLLRDLIPWVERNDASLSRMNCEKLIMELKQVMQQRKCLVVLEEFDLHRLEDLDIMFGLIGRQEGIQSKLVITNTTSDINDQVLVDAIRCHRLRVFKLCPPTPIEIMDMLEDQHQGYWDTNPGIKWNMLKHCSNHPFSNLLLAGLLKMKENLPEWAAKHSLEEQVTGSNPQKIFAMCYNDLPLHLKSCLIFLASFSESVEIPTKRLFQMWIAAGFVRSKHDEVVQTEEHLENLASTYLTELVQRSMVTTIVKEGSNERAKACRLRFGLRDMCLEKAKEEHILTMVDLCDQQTIPTSNTKLKTQQSTVYLDQISSSSTPTSLDHEKLISSLGFICSPTSLFIFPNINDPLYNEEKWDWLLYICKNFQLLRVLDLGGLWMTKGSLPKDVGELRQLRYLSLKGTWVSELLPSIENLKNLQTLDLRVLESIILPDVLWKLSSLMNLFLPEKFSTQETVSKLQLCGLNCLQTLVNLHTDKVCLNDLLELKLLKKISIKKIDVVDELDNIFKQGSKSLQISINSEIINANSTILSSFQNLHKLKIKGMISIELCPEMFPAHLEELTLKHTKLERDPLPVLENLPKLRSLSLGHESFLGKTMTFSGDFQDRTILTLCSLNYLEKLYVSEDQWNRADDSIQIIDCWRVSIKEPYSTSSNTSDEEAY